MIVFIGQMTLKSNNYCFLDVPNIPRAHEYCIFVVHTFVVIYIYLVSLETLLPSHLLGWKQWGTLMQLQILASLFSQIIDLWVSAIQDNQN